MSWPYESYDSFAEQQNRVLKKIKALKKEGKITEPVEVVHRLKIAASFWGRAWCRHLESFSDYENRLPRGRTYVRKGSVLHLAVEPGHIEALVAGADLYEQSISVDPLTNNQWATLKKRCQGKIGSLVELLQGKFSDEIMAIVTDRQDGLFPSPRQIHTDCNCPDWADLCKHLAAVLYGFGARLDSAPELLFRLRGVDHHELIDTGADGLAKANRKGSRRRTLDSAALGDVFGIELEDQQVPAAKKTKLKKSGKVAKKAVVKPKRR